MILPQHNRKNYQSVYNVVSTLPHLEDHYMKVCSNIFWQLPMGQFGL